MDGSTNLAAANAKALRAGKAYIPIELDKMNSMINFYGVMLAAILGYQNPTVLGDLPPQRSTVSSIPISSRLFTNNGDRSVAL